MNDKGSDMSTIESAETRRDNIATGALALGELVSGEGAWRVHLEQQRAAGIPDADCAPVPDEVARASVHFAAGLVQLVRRVVAEELDVPEAVRAARRGEETRARWEAEAALAKAEAQGVKVGDTFRRCGGRDGGEVFEVTNVQERFGHPSAYLAGYGWQCCDTLTAGAKWERVRAVDVQPRASEPDGGERLATAEELAAPARAKDAPCCCADLLATERPCVPCLARAGTLDRGEAAFAAAFELPADADLDGPAGDERAGAVSDAAQALADMTALRDAWEAETKKAARELQAVKTEIVALVEARDAFGESEDIAWPVVVRAINALSARAVTW